MSFYGNTVYPYMEETIARHFGLPADAAIIDDYDDIEGSVCAAIEGDASATEGIGLVLMYSTTDDINPAFLDRLDGVLDALNPNRSDERKREDRDYVTAHSGDVYQACEDVFDVVLWNACDACA